MASKTRKNIKKKFGSNSMSCLTKEIIKNY